MNGFFKQQDKRSVAWCSTIAVIFCLSFPVVAQSETMTLTVDAAVDYALENSKSLQSAIIDLQISERAKNTAWNVFIPSVQASGTLSRSNEYSDPFGNISIPGIPTIPAPEPTESDHWTAVANISASLNLSLALIDGIRATKANYEAGLITWAQTQKETELNIRKMFYGLLLQQETLALQKVTLTNAKERVSQAEINYNNGFIPELSLLQAQVTYENQKPTILKAEQGLTQQLDFFSFLLGLPMGTSIVLEGEITPEFMEFDKTNLVQQYLENRLDIQSFNKTAELLGIQLSALNFQSFTPALALSYGWQPVVSDLSKNWFDDENSMDRGSVSITLAWNLINMLPFSSNRQQAQDIKDNLLKIDLQYELLVENAEIEVHNLIDNLEYSKSAINAAQNSIVLAQKSYDMTVLAYESGATELLDVRDAETQLNQAKLGEMSERFSYLSNFLDLEYALNTKLREK